MLGLSLPWIILALPLPLLIWFLAPKTQKILTAALKIPFFLQIKAKLNQHQAHASQYARLVLLFLIWFLLLIALAGPRSLGEPRSLTREGHNIMMVLDISGSMELDDMLLNDEPATRLDVVKRAATEFIQIRSSDKIGLILFGGRAYLQTPLTYDHHNVLLRIADASAGLAGNTTSIGDALGLAVKRLQSVPAKGRVIILLTDGVNNSGALTPSKAAKLAAQDNIKAYTIGLGAKIDPLLLNSSYFNSNASAELDEQSLGEIATLTGGHYFRATDSQSLQAIYQIIHNIETIPQTDANVRPQHDYYPWPLAIAIFLLLCLLTIIALQPRA